MSAVTVSVVVNNRDYGRFLGAAIDSALAQTHPAVEVVVVDDGSTDGSRAVIAGYGDAVTAVLKENGGQASAFNAGAAASTGDVVLFLDADDLLAPTAAERAAAALADPSVAKAHWPLDLIDAEGRRSGGTIPLEPLPDGDLRERVLAEGPFSHVCAPTSGNAFARAFLDRVLPVPEEGYRLLADCYLLDLAPLYGRVARVEEPQALYRVHGRNRFWFSFERQLFRHVELPRRHRELLARHARALGLVADPGRWRADPWWESLGRAAAEIERAVPSGEQFALVDDCRFGIDRLGAREAVPFPERDGEFTGAPADDATAVRELERLRERGTRFAVVGWPAFWWLDSYPAFARHLRANARCVADTELVKAFELDG